MNRTVCVLLLLSSACCGGSKTEIRFNGELVAARVPVALELGRHSPTSGPFLNVPVCRSASDQFATMIESLGHYRDSGAANLFRNIDGDACDNVLRRVASACQTSPAAPDLNDVRVLNECTLLAMADPDVGADVVRVALGGGPIARNRAVESCEKAEQLVKTIVAVGNAAIFAPLGKTRAEACSNVVGIVLSGVAAAPRDTAK